MGYGNFLEYNELVAHNSFVHCFAEVGLVGYFVWLAILALTWWQIGVVARSAREADPELARWAAAARLSLTAFLAAAFFLSRTYGVMLFLILGLATAAVDIGRREGRLESRLGLGAWLAGIASLEAVTVALFLVVVRLSRLAG